jgi:hypothetical protein
MAKARKSPGTGNPAVLPPLIGTGQFSQFCLHFGHLPGPFAGDRVTISMQPKKKGVLSRLANLVPVLREVREIRSDLRQLNRQMQASFGAVRMAQLQLLMDGELRRDPRFQDPKRLLKYAFRVNSQNGEDGIIREIFRRIGTTNRVFLEIGVGDGTENNTAFLLSQGWTGFWIDGSGKFVEKARERGLDRQVGLLSAYVSRENVESLLAQLKVPAELDLFSLDVDFNTYHIWEAFKTRRPRVVVVEYNASLPSDLDWKVNYNATSVWDGTLNFGASLKAYERLGAQLGYKLVGCDFHGNNAFFIRDDLVGDEFAAPFTSENHYEPMRMSLAYHKAAKAGWLDGPA